MSLFRVYMRVGWVAWFSLLICACRQRASEPLPQRETLFPLQSGSYWIYQTQVVYPDESVSVFEHLDSVWISNDTLIGQKRYWVQRSTQNPPYFLRDSADCVLRRNSYGYQHILYSTNVSDTLVNDPPFYTWMTDNGATSRVIAGQFTTRCCRSLLRIEQTEEHHDHFPTYTKNFYTTEFYLGSEQVGLVKHVFYHMGNRIEYELVRYHIQQK